MWVEKRISVLKCAAVHGTAIWCAGVKLFQKLRRLGAIQHTTEVAITSNPRCVKIEK